MLRILSDVSAKLAVFADESIDVDDLVSTHGGPYQFLAEITQHRKFSFEIVTKGSHPKHFRGLFEICSKEGDSESGIAYAKVLRLELQLKNGSWELVPSKSLEHERYKNYPPIDGFKQYERGDGYVRFINFVDKDGPESVLLLPTLD